MNDKEEMIKKDGMQKNIRVAIFGTGFLYQKNKERTKIFDIVVFIDNDAKKQGQFIDGIMVVAPWQLNYYNIDYVVIMSQYFDEMETQLINLGYKREKIVSYMDLDFLNYCLEDRTAIRKWYLEQIERNKEADKKIVLLSPEMTLTGAAIVLFNVAKVLKRNGFLVTVLALEYGALERYFRREQIVVNYDAYMKSYNYELWTFLESFDYIWINTMVLQGMISQVVQLNKKSIWWIHESGKRCDSLKDFKLEDAFSKNLEIYAVGPCALDTLKTIWNNVEVKNLLYGIPDDRKKMKNTITKRNKLVFAMVGLIYDAKAQDVFLKAIENLPLCYKLQADFWIVGRSLNENMLKEIQKAADEDESIKYLGELTREEMKELYKNIDILVCPSRRDTMPVVTIEAMMNYKPCIVSEVTGTAYYIEDGINGYICKVNDVQDLAKKIVQTIEGRSKLTEMGKLARNIYEREFSMKTFEKNLLNIF